MIEYCWSREPGKFVDKVSGKASTFASFTGSTREWYETLVEVTIDVLNQVKRTRNNVNLRKIQIFAHPDVECIFQSSVLYDQNICDGQVKLRSYLQPGQERNKIDFINMETGEVVGIITVLDLHDDGFFAHLKRLLGL